MEAESDNDNNSHPTRQLSDGSVQSDDSSNSSVHTEEDDDDDNDEYSDSDDEEKDDVNDQLKSNYSASSSEAVPPETRNEGVRTTRLSESITGTGIETEEKNSWYDLFEGEYMAYVIGGLIFLLVLINIALAIALPLKIKNNKPIGNWVYHPTSAPTSMLSTFSPTLPPGQVAVDPIEFFAVIGDEADNIPVETLQEDFSKALELLTTKILNNEKTTQNINEGGEYIVRHLEATAVKTPISVEVFADDCPDTLAFTLNLQEQEVLCVEAYADIVLITDDGDFSSDFNTDIKESIENGNLNEALEETGFNVTIEAIIAYHDGNHSSTLPTLAPNTLSAAIDQLQFLALIQVNPTVREFATVEFLEEEISWVLFDILMYVLMTPQDHNDYNTSLLMNAPIPVDVLEVECPDALFFFCVEATADIVLINDAHNITAEYNTAMQEAIEMGYLHDFLEYDPGLANMTIEVIYAADDNNLTAPSLALNKMTHPPAKSVDLIQFLVLIQEGQRNILEEYHGQQAWGIHGVVPNTTAQVLEFSISWVLYELLISVVMTPQDTHYYSNSISMSAPIPIDVLEFECPDASSMLCLKVSADIVLINDAGNDTTEFNTGMQEVIEMGYLHDSLYFHLGLNNTIETIYDADDNKLTAPSLAPTVSLAHTISLAPTVSSCLDQNVECHDDSESE